MSTETWTRRKLPPLKTLGTTGWSTSPTMSQIFTAASKVMYLSGMPWIWTQKVVFSNLRSWMDILLSYCYITTKCLSKLHGLLDMILSTSSLLSKVKSILWLPIFWILKPFRALHSGVKVWARTSTLKHSGPSLFERVKWFHDCVRSSMGLTEIGLIKLVPVSLYPWKKNPTSRGITVLSQGY